ncbi:MAG: hypothetical protein ACOX9C_09770, partial [Kiritimatiellia bacterium]
HADSKWLPCHLLFHIIPQRAAVFKAPYTRFLSDRHPHYQHKNAGDAAQVEVFDLERFKKIRVHILSSSSKTPNPSSNRAAMLFLKSL